MRGFHGDIEQMTLENTNFRKVVYTGAHAQLVLMSLKPGEAIGEETHGKNDQFFRFERGTGRVEIDGNEYPEYNVKPGFDIAYKKLNYSGLSKSRNAALDLCTSKYAYIIARNCLKNKKL